MNDKLKIVFFGTPDFAVASLKKIIKNHFSVLAVVTAADKSSGRGRKLKSSAIKTFAEKNNIPILQPTNLKLQSFLSELKKLQADVFVVVAFRMLPETVWMLPKYGTFNLHASLLPQYRGAAPINWAIINNEKETGVSTFFIDYKIDTGRIILQEKIDIAQDETAGKLHDRLMEIGANLVVKTLQRIFEQGKNIESNPQSALLQNKRQKKAPKIFKEDCRIDWNKPAYTLYNKIRGLNPYPAAFTTFCSPEGKEVQLKIYSTRIGEADEKSLSGNIETDRKTFLKVYCEDKFLFLDEIQLAGKRKMRIEEFLRGYKLNVNWVAK